MTLKMLYSCNSHHLWPCRVSAINLLCPKSLSTARSSRRKMRVLMGRLREVSRVPTRAVVSKTMMVRMETAHHLLAMHLRLPLSRYCSPIGRHQRTIILDHLKLTVALNYSRTRWSTQISHLSWKIQSQKTMIANLSILDQLIVLLLKWTNLTTKVILIHQNCPNFSNWISNI